MKKANIAAIAAALLLSACSNIILDKPSEPEGPSQASLPGGHGSVRVSFSQGQAKTAMPGSVLDAFDHLEYWFSMDSGPAEQKSPEGDNFVLLAGSYTLTVKAYAGAGAETLAAEGSTDFTITEGEDAGPVNLTLHPFASGEGTGSFTFTVQYPSGVAIERFTLSLLAGGGSIDLKPLGSASGTDPLVFSGTADEVPVGYYLLDVWLKNSSGAYNGGQEVVHIYQNLETVLDSARYTFTGENFSAYVVNTGADSGPGSLREALTNALTGKVISVVLEPGSVIELQSPLTLSAAKTLTIEGNGVTLTRHSSWTSSSATSQLLYSSGSSADLTIRRVHFKNGLASDYGGAVRSAGKLTLESCVFSGNRTTVSGAWGGAVYADKTLIVRGCTFYNNSSGSQGGAIYHDSSSSLTLTGNLFYNNTGTRTVYKYSGTPAASYNAIDRAFGAGADQSGWTAGAGDLSISGGFPPPVLYKSFKLISGSGAANVITARPSGYPATDFYGNPVPAANAAAGAVQGSAGGSGYYLELPVTNGGSVGVSPDPDADGFVSGPVTLTANPAPGYVFGHWLVNGTRDESPSPLTLTLTGHTTITAVFTPLVTIFTDGPSSGTTPGTLRYALANAPDGTVISFSGVTPGQTVIELQSPLTLSGKTLTIEGNGVTLTRHSSWTSGSATSQLLYSSGSSADLTIRRVHFKNGLASNYGGAVSSGGKLTLESCVFSENRTTSSSAYAYGGAVYASNTLIVRGCTFYNNSSGSLGGAVYHSGSSALTLTGNLFYGNTGERTVYKSSGTPAASYNVIDQYFGTDADQSGWARGTGDKTISGFPASYKSFKLLSGAAYVITTRPSGYPTTDFYGNPVPQTGAAAGAVQDFVSGSGYYLELSVNISDRGGVNDPSDADGLVSGPVALTASPGSTFAFSHWLVNGVRDDSPNPNTFTLTGHTKITAVFGWGVYDFSDDASSETTPGTIRYALANAPGGDIIAFKGVTPGTTSIELQSPLTPGAKDLTIEGKGVTLTRHSSWTSYNNTSQLIYINTASSLTIRRVHFKDGLALNYGGAIQITSSSTNTMILESCIFSGNRTLNPGSNGGAIFIDDGTSLTVRGCTFYANAGGYGGAIMNYINTGSLILSGNLFYSNTGNRTVYTLYQTGAPAASYNAIDKAFTIYAGWTAGTGDTTLSALGISDSPFTSTSGSNAFTPVSALQSVLPASALADFPPVDFYGNARTWPGAPGAVR